jgi:hypothetical protein
LTTVDLYICPKGLAAALNLFSFLVCLFHPFCFTSSFHGGEGKETIQKDGSGWSAKFGSKMKWCRRTPGTDEIWQRRCHAYGKDGREDPKSPISNKANPAICFLSNSERFSFVVISFSSEHFSGWKQL